jgi:hypothetical protein
MHGAGRVESVGWATSEISVLTSVVLTHTAMFVTQSLLALNNRVIGGNSPRNKVRNDAILQISVVQMLFSMKSVRFPVVSHYSSPY